MSRQLSFALLLLACSATIGTTNASEAASGLTQLAQAQTEPSQPAAPATAAPDPATPDATAADAPEEPIGNVATVTGSASVIRNDKTTPLKVKDDIYLNDVVQTGANSALGITFIDATTFNLKASTKITIDNYVYEDGGKSNAAIFDVAKGTAAFVAASVAKTGDMKITTPTATSAFAAPPASSKCRKVPPPTIRTTSRSSFIPTPTDASAGSRSTTAPARGSAF